MIVETESFSAAVVTVSEQLEQLEGLGHFDTWWGWFFQFGLSESPQDFHVFGVFHFVRPKWFEFGFCVVRLEKHVAVFRGQERPDRTGLADTPIVWWYMVTWESVGESAVRGLLVFRVCSIFSNPLHNCVPSWSIMVHLFHVFFQVFRIFKCFLSESILLLLLGAGPSWTKLLEISFSRTTGVAAVAFIRLWSCVTLTHLESQLDIVNLCRSAFWITLVAGGQLWALR